MAIDKNKKADKNQKALNRMMDELEDLDYELDCYLEKYEYTNSDLKTILNTQQNLQSLYALFTEAFPNKQDYFVQMNYLSMSFKKNLKKLCKHAKQVQDTLDLQEELLIDLQELVSHSFDSQETRDKIIQTVKEEIVGIKKHDSIMGKLKSDVARHRVIFIDNFEPFYVGRKKDVCQDALEK